MTVRRIQHALVAIAIVGAPLALGGAHAQTNAVVAAVLLLALALELATPSRKRPSYWLAYVVALALGATLLQLIPLPVQLYAYVSPGTYDVMTLAPGGADAWRPVSLDPPATAHELVKLAICLCGAVLAARVYGRRRFGDLLQLIAIAGGAVMLLGIMQAGADFAQPYNAFGPVQRSFVASFINSNHMAGFLGFASIATLALALKRGPGQRWIAIPGALAMGLGVFLSLSRGGIGSYVFTMALCAVVLLRRRQAKSGARSALWTSGTLVGVLLLASVVAYSQLVHELWSLSKNGAYYKAQIWYPTPELLLAFPFLGIGRGAFGAAYGRFSRLRGDVNFSHLENEWLQVVVDWGPVLGLLIAIGLGFAVVRAGRRAVGQSVHMIALFALVFLALHNLTDFNLTLSAVALPATMLLAALGQPGGRGRRARGREQVTRVRVWAAYAVLVALVAAASWYGFAYNFRREVPSFRQLARAASPDRQAQLEAVIARHPAYFLFPLIVASAELQKKNGAARSLHWINRAMYLSPRTAGPHFLAGQALLRLGRTDQAVLEYGLACEYQPSLTRKIAEAVLGATKDPLLVARLGRGDPTVREQLAAFLLAKKEPQAALEVLEKEGPSTTETGLALATRAFQLSKDFDRAHARARALENVAPESPTPYLVQADLLAAEGEVAEALTVLERGMEQVRNREWLFYKRAVMLTRLNRLDEARAAARELLAVTGDSRSMARAQALLASLYEKQDQRLEAMRHYQQAIDNHPQRAGYTLALVRLRMQLGDLPGARRALENARHHGVRPETLARAFELLETREALRSKAASESLIRGLGEFEERRP